MYVVLFLGDTVDEEFEGLNPISLSNNKKKKKKNEVFPLQFT